jgi:ketosteroid isomerase-like protein
MASSNLELVQSIYAAWERGDFSSAEWAHPEIDFELVEGPTPGSWTGLAGMAEAMRDLLSAWRELRVRADEYQELDGERVLVFHHYIARGKASGLELSQTQTEQAILFHVRDGKVTRLVIYPNGERALAKLGLAPKAESPYS